MQWRFTTGAEVFQRVSKVGDQSQTGQALLGPLATTSSQGLLIANVVQNCSSASHIADSEGRAPNNALTCNRLLRRVAPGVTVMKTARARRGHHGRVR